MKGNSSFTSNTSPPPCILEDKIRLAAMVVERVSDGIVVTDKDQRIVYVNPAFEKITGYSFAEVKGRIPGRVLQGPASDRNTISRIHEAVKQNKVGRFEVINYTRDGKPIWINLLIHPFFDDDGSHKGYFSIHHDVTGRVDAAEQLKAMNRKLVRNNNRLVELNKELEHFAYALSHDLKEPVRNILGLINLLEDSINEKFHEFDLAYISMIRASTQNMTTMIEKILDYARSGHESEEVAEIQLSEIVNTIREEFPSRINESNACINLVGSETVIRGYPTQIYRLLQNLVSNSLKYGNGSPVCIEIEIRDHGDQWSLCVSDNGMGIAPENHEKIFRLFNRVSSSHESSGIGLALCRRIATLHNGSITVNSQPGKGSLFTVTIGKKLKKVS